MWFYITTAQGCFKISMQKAPPSTRLIFRTDLTTEKILYLECAVPWTNSLNSTPRSVKRVGKRPVMRVLSGQNPVSVSVPAITRHEVTTEVSWQTGGNPGVGACPFPFSLSVLFKLASVRPVDTTFFAKEKFSCSLSQPVRAIRQLRHSFWNLVALFNQAAWILNHRRHYRHFSQVL